MKRALLLIVVGCASVSIPSAPGVRGPKLIPSYEWNRDKTLSAFQNQMLELIDARDEKRLFEHVDPNIRISFGPGGGIEAFKRAWYRQPRWEELHTIFYMGGGAFRDTDHFWAPSVYANWPEQFDAFSFVAVLSRSTTLRSRREDNAPIIATLSFDIVKPLGEPGHIRTADGREGWADPKLLWSPVGYRVGLVRKSGTWKIEAFVSGD